MTTDLTSEEIQLMNQLMAGHHLSELEIYKLETTLLILNQAIEQRKREGEITWKKYLMIL